MGAIREIPQVTQDGQQSSLVQLEITYGGKEAPFGGIDTSAPPAYIDPKCFTNCDGFIVVDNKLVAASLNLSTVPPLWSGTSGVLLIGFGNFYNPTYGTLNYALGYKSLAISGTPTGVEYTFYMTAWVPGNPATYWNDTLTETLYNSATPATTASLTVELEAVGGGSPGTGATVDITGISSLGSPTGGGFYLDGILASMTITGGTGYQVGQTYQVVQGSNVTGQVLITAVDGSGAVTGFTIVPDSYTTTYISGDTGVPVSTAGFNYSGGAATLEFSAPSDVVLQIVGPSGTAEYSVKSNGTSFVTPSLAGNGAAIAVQTIAKAGSIYSYPTSKTGAIVSSILLYAGTNYNVGEIYYLKNFSFTPYPPTDGNTAQIMVTSVGVGGSVTGYVLIATGTDASLYTPAAPIPVTSYTVFNYDGTGAVPIEAVGNTVAAILNDMADDINGLSTYPADANVTASVDILSSSLVLTAIMAGVIGNSITAQDLSDISGPDASYYYFPIRTPTNLTGGSDGTSSGTVLQTVLPNQASIASVGGTLYVGNIGPLIIKYGGPGALTVSTTLQGVRVLRKFAGSLIGLGLIPAPGTVVASTDMILAWTAAGALDVWNPLDLSGNVTGAGFEELADIGDYLTGLIVTSGTAFIIRSQGISYATATGNATLPFNINHIGLGDQGEGAQITELVCQYDQTGAFVSNSNIYQVSNSLSAIGDKIKTALFNAIANNIFKFNASLACAVLIVDEIAIIVFVVGNVGYIFNASNGTWQTITLTLAPINLSYVWAGVFATSNTSATSNLFNQCISVIAIKYNGVYTFCSITEGVPNALALSNPSTVTFPVEEVSFGRDITIDALYVSLWGNVSENVLITFYINLLQNTSAQGQPAIYEQTQVKFASITLTPAQFNNLNGTPTEFQLFSTSGTVVGRSPQLEIQITSITDTGTAQVRCAKAQLYCSYDSAQRPI